MISIKCFTFNPVQENTYVLYNEQGEALIIDPGCYEDAEEDLLKDFLNENKLKPVLLLNTHCHLDHVFGNKFVNETWGLRLHIHKNEEKMLEMAPASGLMFNIPFDNYTGELTFLEDGEIIKFGEDKLEVILAPGHSPGSICFYSEKYQFLIGGDVLFNRSIGRSDLYAGDYKQLLASIKNRLFILPKETKVYPGHGDPTSIGEEIEHNPFLL